MTADELLQMKKDGYRHELVRGELTTRPLAGVVEARIVIRIATRLSIYAEERALGDVYGPMGYTLFTDPDTVRAPNCSFVRADRVVSTPKYYPGAPDLSVMVQAPDDTWPDVLEKKDDYLRAGTQAVVIVDPPRQHVELHRPSGVTKVEDVLAVDDVVPGWRLPLADLFE
jgi:Uma2 family endonuclease